MRTTADTLGRPLRDLRVSVTDRCNFRCLYCMPCDEYEWIERGQLLSYEEIERLVRICVSGGIERVRLTGGEPLVRKDIELLVERLARLEGIRDLSLTTNGAGLAERVVGLRAAGLRRINVSLDSVRPETFERMTQRGRLDDVIRGIRAAREAGLDPVKINTVIVRGRNDSEILELVEFARAESCELRFIEYMDVGNANEWRPEQTVGRDEILETIGKRYPLEPLGHQEGRAPSFDYRFRDGNGRIGVVASVTSPFCSGCTRARLTADGKLVTCLFATQGFDVKRLLRQGADDAEVASAIAKVWNLRSDRYSEERFERLRQRRDDTSDDQKIEMIRLGG